MWSWGLWPARAAAANRSRKPMSWNIMLRLAANFGTGRRSLVCRRRDGRLLLPLGHTNARWLPQEGTMSVLLGAIADDFTGATDLCNTLVRRGMRTVQLIDMPSPGTEVADAQAGVGALEERTVPPAEASQQNLAAVASLPNAVAPPVLL